MGSTSSTSLNAITPQQTHSPSQRADHHHGRSRLHPQVCPVLRNGWHLLRDDFRMYWSSIWHSEVRCWNLPARLDHEVIDPRRHVRYHRSLLASYCGFDCRRYGSTTGPELQLVQWLHAPCLRSIGWSYRTRSRICDWNCWRYGCSIIYAAVKNIRWNGVNPYFWRSLGSLWTYCGAHSQHQEQRLDHSSARRFYDRMK